MPKFPKLSPEPDNDGFTEWVMPTENYKMACCDCGLVHDMEFSVVKVIAVLDGEKEVEPTEDGEYAVLFRARRNNRSTGQLRRNR